MKRFFASATILTAGALALAACGSDGGAASPGTTNTSDAAEDDPIITIMEVDGVGEVLADSTGTVLYASDEEADGQVLCTDDACVSFWDPLDAGPDAPTGSPGIRDLDVIERPDGTRQVTHEGRPLYTFTEDGPGEVTGDGLSDEFDGQVFTWHAVLADGTTSGAADGTIDGTSTIYETPSDDDLGY